MSFENYKLLIYGWILLGVFTFFVLIKITAPFGRHSSAGWGLMINNQVAWFIMEFTVLLSFWWFFFPVIKIVSIPVLIMVSLFTIHYLNRSLIFPFRIRTSGKKIPVIITLSAITFNLINGSLLGYYFAHFATYRNSWFIDFRFVIGLILFVTGMITNTKADSTLIHLRQSNETEYKIPQGQLFRFISCPNHFGEMTQWLGYSLLCWNLPALAFFIWTCANLIPRSLAHHKWYKEKFSEYPAERKAVIPLLL